MNFPPYLSIFYLILLSSFLSLPTVYDDIIPDPDLVRPQTEDDIVNKHHHHQLQISFKYLVNQVLKMGVLSESNRNILENAEQSDPHSIVKIILELTWPCEQRDFYQKLAHGINQISTYHIGIIYITSLFVLCYSFKCVRLFLSSFHVFIIYLGVVYSKINQQYNEIQGTKMATITNFPAHCKSDLTLSGIFSLGWSKFQIGDKCREYHQQVISDPVYEIQYHKCLLYPIISMILSPITVLGEELGSFLESVLKPFPFHLQVFILVFIVGMFGAIVFVVWLVKKGTCQNCKSAQSTAEIKKNKRSKLLLSKCDAELQRWRRGE